MSSLFNTAVGRGFCNNAADKIFWCHWRVKRDEFDIHGKAVLADPKKYLGNLDEIQSLAANIIQTVEQSKHPFGLSDAQLKKDLSLLSGCLYWIADKAKGRTRALEGIPDDQRTKKITGIIDNLQKSSEAIWGLSDRMRQHVTKIA